MYPNDRNAAKLILFISIHRIIKPCKVLTIYTIGGSVHCIKKFNGAYCLQINADSQHYENKTGFSLPFPYRITLTFLVVGISIEPLDVFSGFLQYFLREREFQDNILYC